MVAAATISTTAAWLTILVVENIQSLDISALSRALF
jgi:hypothetical protein